MLNVRVNLYEHVSRWFQWLTAPFRPQPWRWVLPLKGSFYYDAELAEASGWLMVGRKLQLSCEPENRYDRQAVQISLPFAHSNQTALLGYIPYSHSPALTWLLKNAQLSAPLEAKLFSGYRQYQRLHLFMIIQARLSIWQRVRLSQLKRSAPKKPLE